MKIPLLDEPPILVMPTLATIIGLNEAIILQQVHYWLKNKEQAKQDYIDGHYWVYNTYEQWQQQFPFWSIRTIRRTITKLENEGLLLSGNFNKAGFDKTKWYSINYDELNNIFSPTSVQNGHIVCPNSPDGSVQNEQTNTIDYTKNTTKTILFNGATLKKCHTPFDYSILEKQITKSCNKQGIHDTKPYIDIVVYYYSVYMQTLNKEHPRLSTTAMDSVIHALMCGTDNLDPSELDINAYKVMIDQHFKIPYKDCDYNICHFMTEGIRNNRFFETCY